LRSAGRREPGSRSPLPPTTRRSAISPLHLSSPPLPARRHTHTHHLTPFRTFFFSTRTPWPSPSSSPRLRPSCGKEEKTGRSRGGRGEGGRAKKRHDPVAPLPPARAALRGRARVLPRPVPLPDPRLARACARARRVSWRAGAAADFVASRCLSPSSLSREGVRPAPARALQGPRAPLPRRPRKMGGIGGLSEPWAERSRPRGGRGGRARELAQRREREGGSTEWLRRSPVAAASAPLSSPSSLPQHRRLLSPPAPRTHPLTASPSPLNKT
jgi:hypothetical protein